MAVGVGCLASLRFPLTSSLQSDRIIYDGNSQRKAASVESYLAGTPHNFKVAALEGQLLCGHPVKNVCTFGNYSADMAVDQSTHDAFLE